jgi:hypothetical protein
LSNNSPNEIGVFNTKENAPDYILKILSVLEEIIRDFNVTVENQTYSSTITIQDKKTRIQGELLRIISLDIFTKPKSYIMTLYHQTSGDKNAKHIYEIKVIGNYGLNTLKNNLEKLIQGKNLTHRPKLYPF